MIGECMKYIASIVFLIINLSIGYLFTFNQLIDYILVIFLLITLLVSNYLPLKKEKPIQIIDYLVCFMMMLIYEITITDSFSSIRFCYLYLISFASLQMYLNHLRFRHLLS